MEDEDFEIEEFDDAANADAVDFLQELEIDF